MAELQQLAEGDPTLGAAGRYKGAPEGSLYSYTEFLVFSCRHPAAAVGVTTGPTAGTESSKYLFPVSICGALICLFASRDAARGL